MYVPQSTTLLQKSLIKLHIQLLRPSNVLGTLHGDGWETQTDNQTWVFAKHADVSDEMEARMRLNHLDLLTSTSIRIDFQI
jgi:hypothetical protein